MSGSVLDRFGPPGRHGDPAGHWWWTPTRVVLGLVTLVFVLGMVQHAPCMNGHWTDAGLRYSRMCGSSLPTNYFAQGLAELHWPFGASSRYPATTLAPLPALLAWVTALLTAIDPQGPPAGLRAAVPPSQVPTLYGMKAEADQYFVIAVLILVVLALWTAGMLSRADRTRPWAALPFALCPMLPIVGLAGWDLLPVTCVAAALWAWPRSRLLFGVLVGLGAASGGYPVVLLVPLLVFALLRGDRGGRWEYAGAVCVAALVWLAVNIGLLVGAAGGWAAYWRHLLRVAPGQGSAWQLTGFWGAPPGAAIATALEVGLTCLAAVAVLAVVAGRRIRPDLATLARIALVVLVAWLLLAKVYPVAGVLWLLPLVAMARVRTRTVIAWQAAELVSFLMVNLQLGGWLAPSSGTLPVAYLIGIALRCAGQLYLAGDVLRELRGPVAQPTTTRSKPVAV